MKTSNVLTEDINRILENRSLFEKLQDCRILITGATGLIGSVLIRVFIAENEKNASGIHIIGQIRDKKKARETFGNLVERADIQLICSDDFEFDIDCDYIIHTACPTTSKFFVEHPVETIDASLMSTKKMLALATEKKVKGMVYLSSMEEYGEARTTGRCVTEKDCGYIDHLSVRSCYPESKRLCECYCASYASEYNLRVMIARLAQTFGAGTPLTDNRMFMQFARSVIEGKDIVLHTEGKSVSNFCYLSDSIEGILAILLKGDPGEAYNICNDNETRTIHVIAEMVARRIGKDIKVIFDIPEFKDQYGYAPDVTIRLSADKLRSLGWSAKINMEDAYRNLISYIKECEDDEY